MTPLWGALWLLGEGAHPMDVPLPPAPPDGGSQAAAHRELAGLQLRTAGVLAPIPTTLYVNFDGIDLQRCNPSDSKRDCHWYNEEKPIPAFSGTVQTQVGVLQAMRRDAEAFGIRITGVRPADDEDYTMIVYGGTEAEYGALGSAPPGDCFNALPNEIGFAHVDGELSEWVNGGATVSLHEAGHTWGLDHIDFEGAIMFPSGDNRPSFIREECDQVVGNTELDPADGSCPEINAMFCGAGDHQNGAQTLGLVFGPAYVDATAPRLTLIAPADGDYFQAPAEFEVLIELEDDLHPQAYSMWAWLGDEPRPSDPSRLVAPGLRVEQLPVGDWSFHVVVADEAGNESRLDFAVEVGVDPPPVPEPESGCGCRATGGAPRFYWAVVPFGLARRRRRR